MNYLMVVVKEIIKDSLDFYLQLSESGGVYINLL